MVITDPPPRLPRVRADLVTLTRPSDGKTTGLRGQPVIIDGPGEYEVKGIFVTGIAVRPGPNRIQQPTEAEDATLYLFEFDALTVCHLGALDRVPTSSEVEELTDIDVLLVPIGGQGTLGAAQASEVISMLEPRVVIPMAYALPDKEGALERFLKVTGAGPAEPQESLRLTRSRLPEETQVALLAPKS